jgi:paraquat-inducible protein B
VPKAVINDTAKRLAEAEARIRLAGGVGASRIELARRTIKPALAAAAVLILGYVIGRITAPAPMDPDQLRQTLTPSVAATIEPAIRERLVNEMRRGYRVALADTYVRLKEELTAQRREELNRYAAHTLATSNAVTNQLLAELVQAIKAEQDKDLRSIALALHRIETNRLQDKKQLATGLETLAYRTEDEFQRTRSGLVQLLANTHPRQEAPLPAPVTDDPNDRS